MQLKKILVLLSFVLILVWNDARGQYYTSTVGVRLGNASGITGKVKIGNFTYAEGMLTTRWDGFNVTGLATMAKPFHDTPGLAWYYGIGANLGFWDDPDDTENDTELFVGADTIVGMEYTFEEVPINVSIDWKPYFNVLTRPGFVFDEFALSVRFVIQRR